MHTLAMGARGGCLPSGNMLGTVVCYSVRLVVGYFVLAPVLDHNIAIIYEIDDDDDEYMKRINTYK